MEEAYPRLVKDARCVMTGEMEKLIVADTFRSAYFKFKTYGFFNKITKIRIMEATYRPQHIHLTRRRYLAKVG